MANTSFKAENGLSVTGNSQFDYTSKFNANVTIEADQFYIGGNLYVTGTQVFIGGNVAVADIIAGASGLKLGNSTYQWDGYLSNVYVYGTLLNPVGNTVQLGNSTNRWVISGNTLNISTTSTLTGAATLANTIAVTGTATFANTSSHTGAATFANTLGVTGAATFANTLGVTGAATLSNTMSVTGAANALSSFGVNGVTTLASTLSVTGAATLSNNITVAGNAVFSNAISVANVATFSNALSVTGAATFANTTGHTGAATFSNTISVTGTSTLTGNATLSGTLQTISGNANFNGGTLFVDAGSGRVGIGTSTPDSVLTVGGPTKVNSSFTVTGTSSFANSVTFANTTTFNQDVTINANLTVTGTRTYVNTQTLDVGDNIITLNADLPGATAPTENAGIEINRGSSANSRLQWTEGTGWQLSSASVSTFYNIVNEGTSNTNLDSGTLFVDAVNNRVGINNTAPGVALRVTGAADISSTANVQGNANVAGLLGVASGLAVTGTTNTSAQFNVGGGVATTNGATITNTSILLGNSSVNTQISPSQIVIQTTATGNTSSLLSLASTDQVGGSITLQHGNTTSNSTIVLGAQAGNNASIELGGSTSAFIDFKTPYADDFDTRLVSNTSGFTIVAGSSTSANVLNIISANVNIGSGKLFVDNINNRVGIGTASPGSPLSVTGNADITGTANIQSNANVGGTLGVASLLTASALNVTNQTNTATLFVTTSANVGTAFTANSTLTNAIALNVVNQTNTATLYVTTSANVGTAAVINAAGMYTTGVANAFSHTVGAAFTANSTLVNAAAINVVNQTNTATLYVTTSANVGTAFTANATGVYTTGVANAFSHTVGAAFTANSTLVNAAAINVVNQTNTATLFVTTSANVGTAFTANSTLANAIALNVVNQTNTATLFVTTSANVGTAFTANSTLANAIALNVVNQTNTATLFVTTSANVGTAAFINATGVYTTGVANAFSHTVGTAFTANSTLVNAAAINVVNQTNTATLFVTTSANVGTALTISATALTVAPNANFGSGKLFVDAVNGRVGIGVIPSSYKLEVAATTMTTASFSSTDATSTDIYIQNQNIADNWVLSRRSGGDAWSYLSGAHNQVWYTNGIERMRLDAGGNVAISNTTTSLAKFQVYNPTTLGTSAGSQLNYQTLWSPDGNVDYLEFTNTRQIAGATWVGAGSRIQQKVDTTWMGYIQFNGGGSSVDNQGGISLGTGTTTTSATSIAERMRIDIGGNVAIGTTSTSGASLTVAGTVNAAAINIVNQVNTATLYATTSANVGTALTVNATNINAAANLNMGAYTERLTDLTISAAGTTLLNLQSSSIFRVNVSALTTGVANIRFINPPATGIGVSATLIIQYNTTPVGTFAIQGGTSVSNAGSVVKYAYDSAPTLTAANGKSDILSAITYDGGATYIIAPSFMNFTT